MKLQSQRGGTLLGFILGLVLGLGVALGVAVYVTKVPTPFSNKNQTRSVEQDAAENQKNKDWNPNGVLQPKPAASTPTAADGTVSVESDKPAVKPPQESAKNEVKPAVTADPLGDLAKSKGGMATTPSAGASADPFKYFIQVGAYRTVADADSQKARLAMMGLDAKVSERDQGGRTVYRVRIGPYDDKAVAERMRSRLDENKIENTLVRIQR